MKTLLRLMAAIGLIASGCGSGGGDSSNIAYYDITTQPIPKFIDTNYVDLSNIYKVSRFRSAVGPSYTATGSTTNDPFENCRSMKQSFIWTGSSVPSALKVFSPVDGTVDRLLEGDTQVWITVKDQPAFSIRIFSVASSPLLKVGDTVKKGQQIGVTNNSISSDIAVAVYVSRSDPAPRLISYFDVMTDSLFQSYQARGALSRADFIISKEERDAHPLTCSSSSYSITTPPVQDSSNPDQSTSNGLLNWFFLN